MSIGMPWWVCRSLCIFNWFNLCGVWRFIVNGWIGRKINCSRLSRMSHEWFSHFLQRNDPSLSDMPLCILFPLVFHLNSQPIIGCTVIYQVTNQPTNTPKHEIIWYKITIFCVRIQSCFYWHFEVIRKKTEKKTKCVRYLFGNMVCITAFTR